MPSRASPSTPSPSRPVRASPRSRRHPSSTWSTTTTSRGPRRTGRGAPCSPASDRRQDDEPPSAGHENHEIHHQQHQVVVPAVSSPKAALPDEDLLLDGPEHDEDEPDGGELNEDAERHAQAAQHLTGAEHDREGATRADALGALGRVFEMIQSARKKHRGDNQSQE